MTEVAQAGRPQQRVGQGVGQGVGVAVARQPTALGHLDAAQHQRPVGVVGEGVDVDALADAHGQPPSRCSA